MSVDLYCERVGPDLLAEPLNAVTNGVFLVAAYAAWDLACRREVRSGEIRGLIGLCALIGIGSGFFHTFATGWAQLLDVVPILLFQLAYLWVYGRRIAHVRRLHAVMVLATFLGVCLWSRQFSQVWNGSVIYLPALLLLLSLGIYHMVARRFERWILLLAAAVFAVSLVFRTIDSVLCPGFPLGTHFLWHILNGMLMYLLLRGLIVNLTPQPT